MWINANTNTIIKNPYNIEGYPLSIWTDDTLLESLGIITVEIKGEYKNRKFYNYIETIQDNTIVIENILKPLEELKIILKNHVKNEYINNKSIRNTIASSLGFDIDCSFDDLNNLTLGLSLGLLEIKDSNNEFHILNETEFTLLIEEIKTSLLNKLKLKWQQEQEILLIQTEEDATNFIEKYKL